ncbi:PREDICTED: protein ABSCISIC ACID-INSENSITIVE 5 [Tarenaya hassleriana]|uniref:protein ABSCISIC ACID-INSENSITIVE 5 n=1 Tax=Tarenaya hassleriana TaxID=28532 RepID=UPI00053C680F|nr:PREDICTED: protein ABSCISIC ACID-INSENSITIVE 5 [Tarenaya hassleriana]
MQEMVVPETDMMPRREVESATKTEHQHPKHGVSSGSRAAGAVDSHVFPLLGRQSSIYSLTLDEFQHSLCEGGRNFGSMNMDEFLVSVWNAEENQQVAAASHHNGKRAIIAKQPSLQRQGSLTVPAPLCRKTVDEVWSEIHRGQLDNNNGNNENCMQNPENAARQATFGEMTLEDFLIKAGVVREQPADPNSNPNPNQNSVTPAQQQNYAVFQSGGGGPSFPGQSMAGVDSSGFMNNEKKTGGGYPQAMPTQPGVCYGGRVPTATSGGGGAGGYVPGQQVATVGPLSPISSDGLGHGQVDNMGNQFGVDMSPLRGRKRIVDGPVEKVVERRQRRMIKNRESAARSRARKQAYTVELEAELNQLKEENAQLKHALVELEGKMKQQYSEAMETETLSKSQKAAGRLRTLRRNSSCPL